MRVTGPRIRWLGLVPLLALRCDCSTYGIGEVSGVMATSGGGAGASTSTDGAGASTSTGATEAETGSSGHMGTGSGSSDAGSTTDTGTVCEPEPACSRWTRAIVDVEGGQGPEVHVGVDAAGFVVVAGSFAGTIDLGGGDVMSEGQQDIFLARYTPGGSLTWFRTFATTDPNGVAYLRDLAVSPGGTIHITGAAEHDIELGGGVQSVAVAGGWDMYVAEYSENGAHGWSRLFGQSATEIGQHLALTSKGYVVVSGTFSGGTLDVGAGAMTNEGDDTFVLKLDSGGSHMWSRQIGGGNQQMITGVGVDSHDDVLVLGGFDGILELDGAGILSGSGLGYPYLIKLDVGGELVWNAQFDSQAVANRQLNGLAIDSQDNILLGGWFDGSLQIGSTLLMAASFSPFVAKLWPDGEVAWDHVFQFAEPFEGGPSAMKLGVDASDAVWLATTLSPPIDVGGELLGPFGTDDVVIANYDAAGTHLWSGRFGDGHDQRVEHLAVSDDGDAIVAGYLMGTLALLDGDPLQSLGVGPDIFVGRIGACGSCE